MYAARACCCETLPAAAPVLPAPARGWRNCHRSAHTGICPGATCENNDNQNPAAHICVPLQHYCWPSVAGYSWFAAAGDTSFLAGAARLPAALPAPACWRSAVRLTAWQPVATQWLLPLQALVPPLLAVLAVARS